MFRVPLHGFSFLGSLAIQPRYAYSLGMRQPLRDSPVRPSFPPVPGWTLENDAG
jgi:hypothetical protein